MNGALTELAPFPGEQRVSGLMKHVGDYIYLGFGLDNAYNAFSDLWRYSISNNNWEMVLNFPGITSYQNAITDPLVFSFNDNRLFFGSGQSELNLNDFWEIDLVANALISKSPTPMSLSKKKGTTIENKGYLESYYLYEYDLDTDTWTTHQNINGIGFMYTDSRESIFTNNGNIFRSVTTSSPYYNLLFKMNMSYLE
ncbi:MAG: kelch repeat-containing protein [Xanthomarina gelatinilytica]|uniref:kelch repeat-containing protein n=1 Tax=Xanthomarina gelatinilytica TaxID=1137281 RepID=UPI003A8A7573